MRVFEAFTLLEKGQEDTGVKGVDFIKIVQMLCIDYPHSISQSILKILYDRGEDDVIEFDQFEAAIRYFPIHLPL